MNNIAKPNLMLLAFAAWTLLPPLGACGQNGAAGSREPERSSTAANKDVPLSEDDFRALKQRIEELEKAVKSLQAEKAQLEEVDQKTRILERNRELEEEAVQAKAKESPRITIGEKGFAMSSADTNFSIQIKGLLQVDSRTFFGDSETSANDGFLLRRARPILQGTVFRDFDFLFVPDFGGTGSPQIYDAYLNYRYSPELQARVGKFKVPVGLELLQSDKDSFFNERALPTGLVPNRDLGFQLHGEAFGGLLAYSAGVFNGTGDGRNSSNADFEDHKSFAGRLFVLPFKKGSWAPAQGFGVGLAGSYEDFQTTNTAGLPNGNGYSTPAQEQFFTYRTGVVASGTHFRISPQGYWYWGPYGLLGEYVISDQGVARGTQSDSLRNTGWQLAAGWVITGEDATYNGVVPRHPFNPREGRWGAWQVVARYSELRLDPGAFPVYADPTVSANEAQEWSVGLNWYLNRNIRVNASFSHVNFLGAGSSGSSPPASVTQDDEKVFFTRVQLAF